MKHTSAAIAAIAIIVLAVLVVTVIAAEDSKTDAATETTHLTTITVPQTNAEDSQVKAEAAIISQSAETDAPDEWEPDEADVIALAKTLYCECRGVPSTAEKAAVAWCVLNRVDSSISYFPDTIIGVLEQPNQFAYSESAPVTPELEYIARDVLIRWHAERDGDTNVGRTLPAGYVYFLGDGTHNHFTVEWKGTDTWNWSLPNPYQN